MGDEAPPAATEEVKAAEGSEQPTASAEGAAAESAEAAPAQAEAPAAAESAAAEAPSGGADDTAAEPPAQPTAAPQTPKDTAVAGGETEIPVSVVGVGGVVAEKFDVPGVTVEVEGSAGAAAGVQGDFTVHKASKILSTVMDAVGKLSEGLDKVENAEQRQYLETKKAELETHAGELEQFIAESKSEQSSPNNQQQLGERKKTMAGDDEVPISLNSALTSSVASESLENSELRGLVGGLEAMKTPGLPGGGSALQLGGILEDSGSSAFGGGDLDNASSLLASDRTMTTGRTSQDAPPLGPEQAEVLEEEMRSMRRVRRQLDCATEGRELEDPDQQQEIRYDLEDAERDVVELRRVRRQIRYLFGGPSFGGIGGGDDDDDEDPFVSAPGAYTRPVPGMTRLAEDEQTVLPTRLGSGPPASAAPLAKASGEPSPTSEPPRSDRRGRRDDSPSEGGGRSPAGTQSISSWTEASDYMEQDRRRPHRDEKDRDRDRDRRREGDRDRDDRRRHHHRRDRSDRDRDRDGDRDRDRRREGDRDRGGGGHRGAERDRGGDRVQEAPMNWAEEVVKAAMEPHNRWDWGDGPVGGAGAPTGARRGNGPAWEQPRQRRER